MKLKRKEFTDLRQGGMSVNEYLNSFIQLSRYTFFSGSPPANNSRVKRAWPRAISGWVTDRKVFPGVYK
jgi:hypothetical protein